jgi:two-component system, chemotaxis family, chemotaxis protein CheY
MRKKLLIAEDEQDLLVIYRMMLGDDYDVLEAQNGREAVDLWTRFRPDMVLMDIQMPVMSGDAAIREILGVDPHAKILAVTAYCYTPEELGVPVLSKGFGPSEFVAAVESMLHGHTA